MLNRHSARLLRSATTLGALFLCLGGCSDSTDSKAPADGSTAAGGGGGDAGAATDGSAFDAAAIDGAGAVIRTDGAAGAGGGGGAAGSGGAGGTAPTVSLPAGGDHFCKVDVTEAGAWPFGAQIKCRATFAKTPPLTSQVTAALNADCQAPYAQVVTACPQTDAVGFCLGVDSPVIPTRTYVLVNKSSITPDTTALALNGLAICSGQAYDLTGKPLKATCAGSVKAKVDGVLVDFPNLLCTYKSNGTKSQYFVQAQDTTKTKSFNLNILKEGAAYTVPGNAIAPGFSYIEGNSTFAFPKSADAIQVDVTKFAASGAGLVSTFTPGEMYSQPNGKGAGPRTITEGSVDIVLTP